MCSRKALEGAILIGHLHFEVVSSRVWIYCAALPSHPSPRERQNSWTALWTLSVSGTATPEWLFQENAGCLWLPDSRSCALTTCEVAALLINGWESAFVRERVKKINHLIDRRKKTAAGDRENIPCEPQKWEIFLPVAIIFCRGHVLILWGG